MTNKRKKVYDIIITALCITLMTLCAYMGITAIQKSMNMKIGVNITPSHEIRIDYGGETIFCNTTKYSGGIVVASGYTLNANTLTFTQEFLSIGQTFALTIFNYNTSYLQVSVSGTGASGNTIIIAPYSETASSEVLNLTISAGVNEAVLSFKKLVICSVSYSGENYTFSGKSSIMEGNSYSTTFSASEYYNLPNTITITMGGESLTSGYTYTKSSDTSASLTINSVTGDVAISCTATEDVVNITINVYLNNTLNTTETTKITYNNTSVTITIRRNYGSGIQGTIASASGNHFADYTFSSNSGSGTGYNWNCSKFKISSSGTDTKSYLKVTVDITWGTVASSITVDIYGTSSS